MIPKPERLLSQKDARLSLRMVRWKEVGSVPLTEQIPRSLPEELPFGDRGFILEDELEVLWTIDHNTWW
jgi:hypothetical protein